MGHRTAHVLWDHLPFWIIAACAIGFMAFDIWAMATDSWIYAPASTGEEGV